MKRLALIFIIVIISLGLTSCDNQLKAGSKELPTPSTQTESAEKSEPEQTKQEAKQFEPQEIELISHATPLLDKRKGRLENIRLAIKEINGIIINPNQVFSFNETVGQRTVNKGYKEAIIFKENKKEPEVGGGICQVSSTLHAAAKRAGFEITERYTHQLPVDYSNPEEDATVYYGELDLKFKNNTQNPIRIYMLLEKDDVLVTINSILVNYS